MPVPFRFDVVIALAAAAALVAAAFAGLPETLGAHPFWARQTGIVGGVGGAMLWLVLRRAGLSAATGLAIAVLILLVSAAAAHFGKQVFAASFAENARAGRFWFFGWFGLCGAVAFILAAALARIVGR